MVAKPASNFTGRSRRGSRGFRSWKARLNSSDVAADRPRPRYRRTAVAKMSPTAGAKATCHNGRLSTASRSTEAERYSKPAITTATRAPVAIERARTGVSPRVAMLRSRFTGFFLHPGSLGSSDGSSLG